jgi:hypothetical protein
MGVATGVTMALCTALDSAFGSALAHFDNPELRAASNATRASAQARRIAVGAASSTGGTPETADNDPDTLSYLLTIPSFVSLKALVEQQHSSVPIDYTVVAASLAFAESPCGLMSLTSQATPDSALNSFRACRTDSILDGVLNAALIAERGGSSLTLLWDVAKPGIAKKLVAGRWDPKEINLWKDVAALVVAARDGQHAADSIGRRPSSSSWSDPEALRLARKPVLAAMALVGLSGSNRGSFAAFYHGISERVQQVANLPDSEAHKGHLLFSLNTQGDAAMKASADIQHILLRSPPHLAVRPVHFIPPHSRPTALLAQFDADHKWIFEDYKLRSRFAANSSSRPGGGGRGNGDGGAHAGTSTGDASTSGDTSALHQVGDKRKRPDATAPHDVKSRGRRKWVEGIWSTPTGQGARHQLGVTVECCRGGSGRDAPRLEARPLLSFGKACHVTLTEPKRLDLTKLHCAAAIYGSQNLLKRWSWCTRKDCVDDTHHAFPDSFTAEDFTVTWIDRPSAADALAILEGMPSWTKIYGVPALAEPAPALSGVRRDTPPASQAAAARGRGKGRGKSRGREGQSQGRGRGGQRGFGRQ